MYYVHLILRQYLACVIEDIPTETNEFGVERELLIDTSNYGHCR